MAKKRAGWNYRIIRTQEEGSTYYQIYEVYYTNDKPTSWSADPMWPGGDDINELRYDLLLMAAAFSKPPLEIKGNKLIEIKNGDKN